MTKDDEETLRNRGASRLNLYIRELGEEFYARLVNNKSAWLCGYDEGNDYYWVTPNTEDGYYLPPPFMVLKWSGKEF
jgi:hypothetical protein